MTIAEALKIILDTKLYTKEEWITILNVDSEIMELWLSGKEIPGGIHLWAIKETLREDHRFEEARMAFEEAIDEKLPRKQQFVTDFDVHTKNNFNFLGQTLRHHMVRPHLHASISLLATLNPYVQESLLKEFVVKIRQEREKHGQKL